MEELLADYVVRQQIANEASTVLRISAVSISFSGSGLALCALQVLDPLKG